MVTNLRLNLSAIVRKSGRRAMEPSSLRISIKTPEGLNPANLAKSMDASVCPVRRKTPSDLLLSGKI